MYGVGLGNDAQNTPAAFVKIAEHVAVGATRDQPRYGCVTHLPTDDKMPAA